MVPLACPTLPPCLPLPHTMVAKSYFAFIILLIAQLFTFISSLAGTERLFKCSYRRCYRRDYSQMLSLRCSDDDASASAVLNDDDYFLTHPQMVPLSETPLLLLQSSTPIISREGCLLLSRYFDQQSNADENDRAYQLDKVDIHRAETLLRVVHDVIDKLTNCLKHDGEMQMPRYVRYDSVIIDEKSMLYPSIFRDILLPDGLHVDTNNGKLFRHLTAILYLTDSVEVGGHFVSGGGTTFPLAVPFGEKGTGESNKLQDAGRHLLRRGIHHTKGDKSEYTGLIENAALNVFNSHVVKKETFASNERHGNNSLIETKHCGIRVMPSVGKLIYFHNVDDDGLPDPLSFHCGEELITLLPNDADPINLSILANTKRILVFFKEIPMQTFKDGGRESFAEQTKKARYWTKLMYY